MTICLSRALIIISSRNREKKKSRTVFCHSLQDQMKHIARLSTVLSPLLQKVLDLRFNEILFVLSADQ